MAVDTIARGMAANAAAKAEQAESATAWIGVTTTMLTDGSTTNPITINEQSVTATAGNIAQYNSTEYIWSGSAWQEFGGGLPAVTAADDGDVLGVVNGAWNKMTAPSGESNMVSTTYAALKVLRDNNQLVPGTFYRMTDYTTIITGSYDLSVIGASGYLHNARSAGHAFDLILLATGTSELSEAARAALHSEDAYFSGVDIDAWELRYCLDNDTNKFAFANPSGKGVIYWMKDEWNNQAGYDFKNIQFLRYAMSLNSANPDAVDTGLVYDASTQPNRYAGMMQIYSALNSYMQSGSYVNPWGATGNYDFAVSYNILGAVQMAQPDATYLAAFEADWYYTFDFYGDLDESGTDAHYDASLNQHPWIPCRENYIELETDPVAALLLQEHNHIGLGGSVWETNGVFLSGLSSDSHWNSISENRLGQSNFGNTFGNLCYGIITKNYCNSNTFGNYCNSNTFGDNCDSNTFGEQNANNEFIGNMMYLHCGDHVQRVRATTAEYGANTHTIKMLENYDGNSGNATLITKTGYNTETVVSTTDGGTTWA